MPTVTDIANLALSRLGEQGISDISENIPNAIRCRLHYETARDSLLRSHQWNFATVRAELTQLEDAPAFGWTHAYQLPADFLCLSTLNGAQAKRCASAYVIEGDNLLTNAGSAQITYVKKVTDPNRFDSLFADVLIFRLAAAIAMDVTGDAAKRDSMETMAGIRLDSAAFVDANETQPEVLSPLGSHGSAARQASLLHGFQYYGNAPDAGIDLDDGSDGANGWTASYALVTDGERRVMQITGWSGGGGEEPQTGYVGVSGIVSDISEAIDLRGATGPIGPFGTNLWIGDTAPEDEEAYPLWWKSDIGLLMIWYDDGDSEQWVSAVGAGPIGPSAYDSYVATTADDPVLSETAWIESLGGGGGGGGTWGSITGTLSDQTDLQAALDAKVSYPAASTVLTDIKTVDGTGSGLDADLLDGNEATAFVAKSALGTGVETFLGTPSSANLRAAMTDETGTGALVFQGLDSLTLGTSGILIGGTNTIEQRNSTNAQALQVYGTYTSSTNYERLTLKGVAASNFIIGTEKGSGGGTARGLSIQTGGTTRISFDSNGISFAPAGTTRGIFDTGGVYHCRSIRALTADTIGFTSSSSTSIFNAADTALSRLSAGVMGLGTGATASFAGSLKLTQLFRDRTDTAAATTGAQTINKAAGSVNFAAAATSLVVTNSLVTASSTVHVYICTNDTTLKSVVAVSGSGSFTIHANAAANAETRVAFIVHN
jgi:hypothetical protein